MPWSQDSIDELDPGTHEPLNKERLLIRRARLHAETTRGPISGALEFDGNTINGAVARLLGAQATYTFARDAKTLIAASAGLFKTPFGAEVPASERDKPFLEPPAFARALIPGNYDAGVMVHGEYGAARWVVAAVNGAPVGDAQWHGKDPSSTYDFVGRIGAVVEGPYRSHFEIGASGLSGSGLHAGAAATKDDLQWVDANGDGRVQINELVVVPGASATRSQTFDRNALGFDVQAHWCVCVVGKGFAFAEGVLATNLDRGLVYADPIALSRDQRHLGFAVGVVQDLGTHASVGVRYDRYNADRDVVERSGVMFAGAEKIFSTLSVMASGRLSDARFLVQYDHERNPFGRSDNGLATTRAADRITVRAQVGF